MEEQNVETTQWEISIDTWTNSITDNAVVSYWLKIWIGVAVFIILMILSKVVTRIVRKNIKRHLEETNPTGAGKIAKLLGSILFWVLMLFALFICFEIMWINIWLLISWVSLWVWLAFKEVLWNMFAWIMILYTKEFKMWDIIEIQSGEWYFWRIEEITIRYTVIRTLDLRQVVIPNMTMISEPIKTFSSEDLVKLNTIIWISYDSDVTKAIQVLKDTINSFDFVKAKENTTVYVLEFGASTINLKCVFCFDPKCGIIWEVAVWQINERVPRAFEENWIAFSYDHIVLNFEDTNKETNEKVQALFANEAKNSNDEKLTINNEEEIIEEPQTMNEWTIDENIEENKNAENEEVEEVESEQSDEKAEEISEEIANKWMNNDVELEMDKWESTTNNEIEVDINESKKVREYANEQVIPGADGQMAENTESSASSQEANPTNEAGTTNVNTNGESGWNNTENMTNSFYNKY